MRITFLCGSLEPGRDGVGDYVRRLSIELIKEGHKVSAIALNDHHIREYFFGDQVIECEKLKVLRLPSIWAPNKRFARAKQWMDEFNADWLSLQFVPFSFHEKGLPFNLVRQLVDLGRGKQWHIMFHELWLGMEKETPIKYRLLGRLQYFIIKSLISKLQPIVIHTHTQLYQIQLARLGAIVYSLPLFGNIPVEQLENGGFDTIEASRKEQMSLILFGNIHHSSLVQQFANEVAGYSKSANIPIVLTLIGRCGNEAERWVSAWQEVGLTVEIVGEQSPADVSRTLQKATIGLVTTPAALVEKSGAAAAMREHGLQIICIGRPWNPKDGVSLKEPAGIFVYKPGSFRDYMINKTEPVSNENMVSFIAKQFLESLNS